jgi:hypothetical protein
VLLASSLASMFFPADVNVAFEQSAHKVLLDDDNRGRPSSSVALDN